jgi:predicted transcriptional regulator
MAISNELSSEIAAALLSKKTSPRELKQLHDVILQVHNTLQSMQKETSPQHNKLQAKAMKHERDK